MITTTRWIGLVVLAGTLAAPARAGLFDNAPKNDSSEQLARLFGADRHFTGTALITVKNRFGKETNSAETQYAVLDGKVRMEIDLSKTRSGEKHADAMDTVAGMGLSRMVALYRSDKKAKYIVFPGVQGYCEEPVEGLPIPGDTQPPKMEKTQLGQETIDGHPCVKYKVILKDSAGHQQEMIVWEATDLQDFPIQTQMKSEGDTIIARFKDINLAKPPVNLFEIPAGYKRYDTVNDLMMGAFQQMLPGGGK